MAFLFVFNLLVAFLNLYLTLIIYTLHTLPVASRVDHLVGTIPYSTTTTSKKRSAHDAREAGEHFLSIASRERVRRAVGLRRIGNNGKEDDQSMRRNYGKTTRWPKGAMLEGYFSQ